MGDRYALLIANDSYEDPGLLRLTAPAHDIEALQQVLADPQIGRFEVSVLRNEPHHVINLAIARFFADRHRDDLLLVHYSGHGLKASSGDLYLAGVDTSPAPNLLRATAVEARFVNQEMAGTRAGRVVLLLDCCYGGAFSRGLVPRAAEAVTVTDAFPCAREELAGPGRGRVVITAASATEYAFEDGQLAGHGERQPSVFTSALVHGLVTGDADLGGDGTVDLDELYDYVYQRVRSAGRSQTPTKVVLSATGKFVLAWTPPSRRIVALPPELPPPPPGIPRPSPTEQLTTVAALRRVLLDEDVARAAGALDALRTLAQADSRSVGDAAQSALDEGQLRAAPPRIEVELSAGDPAPIVRTVRLIGAPLAKVLTATSTNRWLRVEHVGTADPQQDAIVTVTIDPARIPDAREDVQGQVCVTNPLGTSDIPVVVVTAGAGRTWWPDERRLTWLRQAPVLPAAAVLAAMLVLINSTGLIRSTAAVGVVYLLARGAVLVAGLRMATGSRQAVGLGLLSASTSFLLTDALTSVHWSPGAAAWLELLAVSVFTAVLCARLWPFPGVPRTLRWGSVRGRPSAAVALIATAGYLFLLFVSPGAGYFGAARPMIEIIGLPAALTSVIAVVAFNAMLVLRESVSAPQRSFAVAAMLGYFGPELLFLAGSFVLGPDIFYLGSTVYDTDIDATWYVCIQLAMIAVLLGASLRAVGSPTRIPTRSPH